MPLAAPTRPAPRLPSAQVVTRDDPARTVWFLNDRITFQLMRAESAAGVCIMLTQVTRNDAPPWHIHHAEDEVFHIVAGEVRFRVGDTDLVATAGQTVLAPCGVPHGFRVMSDRAEMLVVTRGGFEDVVRTIGRPPEHDGVPDHAEPSPEVVAALVAVCAANDIDILGPPID